MSGWGRLGFACGCTRGAKRGGRTSQILRINITPLNVVGVQLLVRQDREQRDRFEEAVNLLALICAGLYQECSGRSYARSTYGSNFAEDRRGTWRPHRGASRCRNRLVARLGEEGLVRALVDNVEVVAILALFDHDLVLSDGQGGGGLNEEIALLWRAVAKDGRLGRVVADLVSAMISSGALRLGGREGERKRREDLLER